jgi:hypothetical protein
VPTCCGTGLYGIDRNHSARKHHVAHVLDFYRVTSHEVTVHFNDPCVQ